MLEANISRSAVASAPCHDSIACLPSKPLAPIDEVIDQAIALNELAARRRHIHIVASSASHLFVAGDARSLTQIVDILLNDAVRFAPARSVVSLAITRENGAAIVRLWDEGHGATSEGLAPRASTGLGLRVARLVAERLGGSVSAAERAPSRGTLFKLTLPLATAR